MTFSCRQSIKGSHPAFYKWPSNMQPQSFHGKIGQPGRTLNKQFHFQLIFGVCFKKRLIDPYLVYADIDTNREYGYFRIVTGTLQLDMNTNTFFFNSKIREIFIKLCT